jgi:acyl-CoA synthetase (AMP-forming)/AMP-acid ligase II
LGRTSDEKVPRAWIVLSPKAKRLGAQAVIKELDDWHKKNLSKYKWLRGGFEIVTEVYICIEVFFSSFRWLIVKQIPKSPTGKTLRRVLQDQYEARRQANVKL